MTKGRQQLEKCLLGKRFLLHWIKKMRLVAFLNGGIPASSVWLMKSHIFT